MVVQGKWVDLNEELKDIFLSKLSLDDLVCWASACKSNASDLQRFLNKELRVSWKDVLGNKTGKKRERAKRSFFVEFLSKHATSIRKVYIDWGSQNSFRPNHERLCDSVLKLNIRSFEDETCSFCNDRLCLANVGDYAVLSGAENVFFRAGIAPQAFPLRMFPQVKHLHVAIPWVGQDRLSVLSSAQLAQLESLTLCGCFGGHLPVDLSELKAAPNLRELTLLRNMDGHDSISQLPDLSCLRSVQELRLGTNDGLFKGKRLEVTRHTLEQKENVETFLREGEDKVGKGFCSPRSITLLIPQLPEKSGNVRDLWGWLPGIQTEQYERIREEAVQRKKEADQLARSYGWKVDEQ